MNRNLFFLIIIICLLSGCKDKQNKLISKDLLEYHLIGHVKSCNSALYEAIDVNGKIVQGDFSKYSSDGKFQKLHFRVDGMIDTMSYLDEKGNCLVSFRYYYNDVNLKTYLITAHFEDLKVSYYDTTSYSYNSNLKLIIEKWAIGNIYHGLRTSSYDMNGFLISDSTFDPPWKMINRNVWKYDVRGNVTENAFYSGYDKLSNRTYFDYDSDNRKIYEAYYDYPDEYSSNGRYNKYEYNSFNKVKLKQRYTKDGKLREKSETSFNNNGDEEKSVTYDFEDNTTTIETFKYEYDDKGNWTKKIRFYDAKPSTIEVREISYYQSN